MVVPMKLPCREVTGKQYMIIINSHLDQQFQLKHIGHCNLSLTTCIAFLSPITMSNNSTSIFAIVAIFAFLKIFSAQYQTYAMVKRLTMVLLVPSHMWPSIRKESLSYIQLKSCFT